MNYFSAFSGIGGFEYGIHRAFNVSEKRGGEKNKKTKHEKGERLHPIPSKSTNAKNGRNNELRDGSINQGQSHCIGYSEVDKYAIQIYQKHYPLHKNYGDITQIQWGEVPDFDLFVGGFPCQSFSIAGKRKGFQDTRGTLFFDIARGLQVKQPDFVLLENVKGLMSHDKGKTLEVILRTLQELGYYVNIEVYNSKDFSVPQNRERIFFLCRHIKTLLSDGQRPKINLSSPIIDEFLFQILLNNLTEVQKLQEAESKDWVLGYLICQEIYQNPKLKGKNILDGIMTPMAGKSSLFRGSPWQNIDTWLRKNLVGNSKELNKSTTSTAIRQIIESKTYTYSKLLLSILAVIVQSRNLSKDSWKKTLLNLTLIREHTKKYARFNDKKEEVIVTETGNAYLISDLQDFEKYFVTGSVRGTRRPKVFPIGQTNKKDTRNTGENLSYCLDSNYHKGTNTLAKGRRQLIQKIGGSQGMRVYDTDGVSTTIAGLAGGWGAKTGLYAIPVLTPDRAEKRQNGRRFKNDGDPSFTLTSQDKHGVYDGTKIRRLTPTECERLQGFPDGWTKGVSDTQRYKCLGNAVTTNVITAIIERLFK